MTVQKIMLQTKTMFYALLMKINQSFIILLFYYFYYFYYLFVHQTLFTQARLM
jgi:hypothetical protein